MDGNGRWAQIRGLHRIVFGHRRGIQSVRAVVEEGCRLGLEQLTLYCLSVENWKRPPRELSFLLRLLRHFLVVERAELMEQNVRLTMIGRREGLPDEVLREFDKTVVQTAENTGMVLCLAVNYGGRTEIADGARRLAEDVRAGRISPDEVDEFRFAGYLSTAGMPDPDLLIRTAGELRISNFLLWQISYSELWVTDVLWPDFRADDLLACRALRRPASGSSAVFRDMKKWSIARQARAAWAVSRTESGLRRLSRPLRSQIINHPRRRPNMLSTRLAIGFSMVGLLLAVLCLDEYLAPWFPFWFILALARHGIRVTRARRAARGDRAPGRRETRYLAARWRW